MGPSPLGTNLTAQVRPSPSNLLVSSPGMARILVVDDEREIVTLLRYVLEKEGYKIFDAGNGQEALDRLGMTPGTPAAGGIPDLIILDIMMPVMDGYTLNMKLQASDKTRRIPILVLTAK